jgi:hypothetical protein
MTKLQIKAQPVLGVDVSGPYTYHETYDNRPVYKHKTEDLYLWYHGWWKVDTGDWYNSDKAEPVGYIRSEVDVGCPELVDTGYWKYYDDNMAHTGITVTHGKITKIHFCCRCRNYVFNFFSKLQF